jgi:hypothetical protein
MRFQGLGYIDPTLAAFVDETITIRHEPTERSR